MKRRNRFKIIVSVLMLAALFITSVYAYELVVITSSEMSFKKLTAAQVQRIFLRKERLTKSGKLWVPVNLKASHRPREIFTEKILQKSYFELERYWNEQYFNGISPPYVLASEEAVIRFVKETPFALGYILSCHVDARVKVVYSFRIRRSDAQLCR